MPSANRHRDHLRYNLLTAQYPLPHLITFTETTDHLHRNPHYNHRRPHQALKMKTPAEAFALAA
ncbi:aminotransferase [Ralstonia solanacearum]|nr:aminotransferase [Ralstonia solanacearum]